MDPREETIQTYRTSAPALAAYFDGIGSRKADVDRAFSFIRGENLRVVEIGCGNGRDAGDILAHTDHYLGFDISEGMIELARATNPAGRFEVADLRTYVFPHDIDLVFAFASLLHSDREKVRNLLSRVHRALPPNGIVYISLKEGAYREIVKEDAHGVRVFFLYTPNEIRALAGTGYRTVYEDMQTVGHTRWFTIALQKIEYAEKNRRPVRKPADEVALLTPE